VKATRTLRTSCGASATCDAVRDTDDPHDVLVQGRVVSPDLLEELEVPEGEGLLRVQRNVLDVSGVPLLDAEQLGVPLDTRHRADLFRVETLDHYAVDSDAGEFAQFLRGESGPDLVGKAAWLDGLRADHAAGRGWRYVHVLRRPLTDYLRYELDWCYRPNADAGMDIRILDLAEAGLPDSLLRAGDFFVIDGDTVVRMHYDQANDFAGAEIVNQNPAVYVAHSELLWTLAEPFATWWARHPEARGTISAA
jgi:hypothetical protein